MKGIQNIASSQKNRIQSDGDLHQWVQHKLRNLLYKVQLMMSLSFI